MILRVRKEDSAYLYQLLESYEGLANYSTIPSEKSDPHRDIVMHLAPDLTPTLERVLAWIAQEIPLERLK
jgi:hypothetical protein